jgi:beta-mannosidase
VLTLAHGRIRGQSGVQPGDQLLQLADNWQLCEAAPGRFATPADLTADLTWMGMPALGPVADILRRAGQWSLDAEPRRFDASDWWYRVRFDASANLAGANPATLGLDGLATVAEVWLNGQQLLVSTSMHLAHRLDVSSLLRADGNELTLVFRSLDQALTKRRPRPRWRAPMIENQQLRWFRTTLLGRTPGWSPPAAVVGPWRGIWLASQAAVEVRDLVMQPTLNGDAGDLTVQFALHTAVGVSVDRIELTLARESVHYTQPLSLADHWRGDLHIEQVARWWPHTHGKPALYEASLSVWLQGRAEAVIIDLGRIGFRTVDVDQSHDGFAVSVNGAPVFCRGACWTPLDPVTMDGTSLQQYAQAIKQVRDAGMNMIRLGGTMSYEADAFYDECDRQGIMVWQDFMFANMDYPEDADFTAQVTQEVTQQMARWQGRPSITVLCGNSEVEQQAAMFGATRERWAPALFHETLPALTKTYCPDVPYWPSSAHGGAFPHQGDVGTTSYYGVGAYMRSLDDARRANVRFATECLAFSNVPEPAGLAHMPGGLSLRMHHPAWKTRAPRDLGAGWDFEDVRDHYLAQLFDVDPARLRYSDHDRYLALGRVAVGEVMAAIFAEWRRPGSTCRGALIWFLRDLWPGAGGGVVDSQGDPKAPYYYLKRALQPVSISMTDEGGNGLYVHIQNESAQPLQAEVEVTAWRQGQVQVASSKHVLDLAAHDAQSHPLLAWFDWFADWSWSYKFGPASAQVLRAALKTPQGEVLAEAFAFPTGLALPMERDLGLRAVARLLTDGEFEVIVSTDRFAQAVHFDVDHAMPDDAYFHLAPGAQRRVILRHAQGAAATTLSGCIRALNCDASVTIQMAPTEN